MKKPQGRQQWLDVMAMGASSLCLIHCLVLPLFIALLPALAVWLTLPETVHVWALLFAVPTSLFALVLGYRGHRRCRPMAFAVLGLLLLGAGAFPFAGGMLEVQLSVAGALLVGVAHVLNWRAGQSARA